MAALESNGHGTPSDTLSSTPPNSISREDFQRVLAFTARAASTKHQSRFDDGSTCPHGLNVSPESAADLCELKALAWWLQIGAYLVQDENGQPLSQFALRSRFDKARTAAGVNFQFRDIRAKAATDTGDLAHSQTLLGHKNRDMTEHYVKARIGERVKPLR